MIREDSAYDLLDQDDVWVTRDGSMVPLDELSLDQCRALLAWYRARAEAFRAIEERELGRADLPSSEVAFDMVIGGVMEFVSMSAEQWLSEQPLISRLEELVDARDGVAQ